MKADTQFWRDLKANRQKMTKTAIPHNQRTGGQRKSAGRQKRFTESFEAEEWSMTTTTEFQLVDINKLVPYANNARTHNKEQILKLRSSLREFGFVNPVIIDREYNVLAGHGRIMAAKEEGIAEVPCVYVDHLTEAQKESVYSC